MKGIVAIDAAASPLEGYGPNEWVAFERALVVRDIFTGGVRTFLSTQDAQAFRALIYKQYSECTNHTQKLLESRIWPWLPSSTSSTAIILSCDKLHCPASALHGAFCALIHMRHSLSNLTGFISTVFILVCQHTVQDIFTMRHHIT